ncbi:MAG: hypothetical protein IJC86_05350 [Clostridia bacterium]|nr:hypothetical protein [Clostridia bacterium]
MHKDNKERQQSRQGTVPCLPWFFSPIEQERMVKKLNLFINSPSYYTQENGVIDDIYQLCRMISLNIDITLYTDALDTIGITPIIAPTQILESGKWKEERKISLPYRMASISLVSDYDSFLKADLMSKRKIIIENILKSLGVIKRRLKDKFDYEQIENDIKNLLS